MPKPAIVTTHLCAHDSAKLRIPVDLSAQFSAMNS